MVSEEAQLPDEPPWDPRLDEEIRRYRGQWVAHTRDRIVAADPDPDKAFDKARSLGVDSPILVFVPEKDGPRIWSSPATLRG